MSLSPYQRGALAGQIDEIRAILGPQVVNEVLLRDTLEGETEVFIQLDQLAEAAIAARELAKAASARAAELNHRAERCRAAMQFLLERAQLKRINRPIYVATIAAVARRAKITDEKQVPDEYRTLVPDTDKIARALKAGEQIAGAELTNSRTTLQLRTSHADTTPGAEDQLETESK